MSGVEFGVLGPVRVWRDDAELRVAAGQPSVLLTLLLAQAGATVPLTEIVDVLWGEDEPPTAVNIVQRHVGVLRRLLEPELGRRETGRWLFGDGGGYRMDVSADSLDLLRFRRLADEARMAAPEPAVALFAEALALWRGSVAAALPLETQSHPAFTSLDRERLTVVKEYATAALRSGRAEQILLELRPAADRHPFDEPLQALLIQALVSAGQQAEAVRVRGEVVRRLRDELGVDPGPELGEALTRPVVPAEPPEATPAQLPSDLAAFAGRADELARLLAFGDDGGRVAAIVGMGGIGKTTLAVHLAHRLAGRYPDGQLYADLRGFGPGEPVAPSEVLATFLEALGVPPDRIPARLDAQAALFRSHLARRRMLILLDNAREAGQIRPLLPGAGGSLVLITSRHRLPALVTTHGAVPVPLGEVSEGEARQLLSRRLGDARVAAEPEAVQDLVERCGRLPLALAVVAARAAMNPSFRLADLAAELRTGAGPLDAVGGTDVFSWSYAALTPDAARLFRLLTLHPPPDIGLPAIAGLIGAGRRDARALVDELTDASLLIERVPGRYVLHDLLRSYAGELAEAADPPADRAAARLRVLDHYLHTARVAAERYTTTLIPVALPEPGPGVTPEAIGDREQALAWFDREQPVLRELLRLAAATGHHRHTWQLVWSLEFFLDRLGHFDEAAAFAQMAVAAAGELADPVAQAHAHRSLGRAFNKLRRDEAARTHLELSLRLFTGQGDGNGVASSLNYIGFLAERQGHWAEALSYSERALEAYRRIDDLVGQAMGLNAVGNILTEMGQPRRALNPCRQALRIFQDLDDKHGEGAAWDSLGYTHFHLGEVEEAIACYRNAIELFRDSPARNTEAIILDHLGQAHLRHGARQEAYEAWRRSAAIYDQFDPATAELIRGRSAQALQSTTAMPSRSARKA